MELVTRLNYLYYSGKIASLTESSWHPIYLKTSDNEWHRKVGDAAELYSSLTSAKEMDKKIAQHGKYVTHIGKILF